MRRIHLSDLIDIVNSAQERKEYAACGGHGDIPDVRRAFRGSGFYVF
jgi:hypothetical protein